MSTNRAVILVAILAGILSTVALVEVSTRAGATDSDIVIAPTDSASETEPTTLAAADTTQPPTSPPTTEPSPAPTTATVEAAASTPTSTSPSTAPPAGDTPTVEHYVVAANESLRPGKQVGVDVVEALTNYDPDEAAGDIVARVTDDPGMQAALQLEAAPLLHEGVASRGQVEYAQLGGHRNNRASIMVVVRQWVADEAGAFDSHTRTVDVRVDLVDGTWRFVELSDAGGTRIERPDDLGAEAVAVLDDPRITIPDSARWDIHAGTTSPTLLRLMSELADITPFRAVVLATGHPFHVFETASVSNHSVGRAVDVYQLGDTKVIDNVGVDGTIHGLARWLFEHAELSQIGSPWNLDGPGRRSFTDDVHLDHFHIGVGS